MTDRALADIAMRAIQRLRAGAGLAIDDCDSSIGRLAIASDFAIEVLARQPQLLTSWQHDSGQR